MEEIFTFKNVDYDLRNNTFLKMGNLRTVYYGTESLSNLGGILGGTSSQMNIKN